MNVSQLENIKCIKGDKLLVGMKRGKKNIHFVIIVIAIYIEHHQPKTKDLTIY